MSAVVSGIGLRRKAAKRGVRPDRVVIDPPGFDEAPGITETVEEVLIQALIAQPAIKALDEGILCWLSRRDVVPLDADLADPFQDRMTGELIFGAPRWAISLDSSLATRTPDRETSTTTARASRVKSSTTQSVRNRRPSLRASDTKSRLHRSFTRSGISMGERVPVARFRPRRRFTARPSSA